MADQWFLYRAYGPGDVLTLSFKKAEDSARGFQTSSMVERRLKEWMAAAASSVQQVRIGRGEAAVSGFVNFRHVWAVEFVEAIGLDDSRARDAEPDQRRPRPESQTPRRFSGRGALMRSPNGRPVASDPSRGSVLRPRAP